MIAKEEEITQAEVNDDGESSDSEEEVQTQQSEDIIDENGNSDTESEPQYFVTLAEQGMKKSSRQFYTFRHKLQAIKFMAQPEYASKKDASKPNFYKVGKILKIGDTTAERWWKDREKISEQMKKAKSGGGLKFGGLASRVRRTSRKPKHEALDAYVMTKFTDFYGQAFEISPGHLVKWGRDFARDNSITFKGSHGWLHRLTIRNNIRYRAVTTSGHTCPHNGREKFDQFMQTIHRKNERRGISVGQGLMGNGDQTSIAMAMPGKKSIARVGATQVAAKNTGHVKNRLTVFLFVVDNGCIEEPTILFKGLKNVPKECQQVPGCHVMVTKKGFATTAVMQYWARTQFPRRRQTRFAQGKPFH